MSGNGPKDQRARYLSTGYRLDERTDPDAVILRREDGSEVAVFGEVIVLEAFHRQRDYR